MSCTHAHTYKGMHWPSALRHLPKLHPLRDVWVKEFHHCTDLREIGNQPPPKEVTLSMAKKCAKEFADGITNAEFTSVSAFFGNYFIAVATAVKADCCHFVIISVCLITTALRNSGYGLHREQPV
jgi:hypothetical protein